MNVVKTVKLDPLETEELDNQMQGDMFGRWVSEDRFHPFSGAERCAAAETWVLADEIHAPLVLAGSRHVPWLEVSDAAHDHGIALSLWWIYLAVCLYFQSCLRTNRWSWGRTNLSSQLRPTVGPR